MNGRKECRCPLARHRHGTRACYARCGCHCLPCRAANAGAVRDRRRGITHPRRIALVDRTGTRRRLEALHALGWSGAEIGARLGLSFQAVYELRTSPSPIYAISAARVAELYDDLWDKLPPETNKSERIAASRSRGLAKRRGWSKPLAWDDDRIDDPDAEPYTAEPETTVLDEVLVERYMTGTAPPVPAGRRAPLERREAIRRLAGKGWDDGRIGRRVGMNRDAVGRERQRHGIPAGTPREAA